MKLKALNDHIKALYKEYRKNPDDEEVKKLYFRLHSEQRELMENMDLEVPKPNDLVRVWYDDKKNLTF